MPLRGHIIYCLGLRGEPHKQTKALEGQRVTESHSLQPAPRGGCHRLGGLMLSLPRSGVPKVNQVTPLPELLLDGLASDLAFSHALGSGCLRKARWNFQGWDRHLHVQSQGLEETLRESTGLLVASWEGTVFSCPRCLQVSMRAFGEPWGACAPTPSSSG